MSLTNRLKKINVAKSSTGCLRPTLDYAIHLQMETGLTRDFIIHESLILFEEAYKKNPEYFNSKNFAFNNAKVVGIEELKKVTKVIDIN